MTVVQLEQPAVIKAPNRPLITVITMVATIMQVLDTTIANVALPHMQGTLGATQDQIAWVLTSYIVAAAISTPITGWLASRFGRTRLFAVALTGFTLASMLCGAAVSLPQIVVFRILQGLFGAALVPLSQAILLDSYPRSEAARAMGIFGMGVMIGPILGPVLGGYLTEEYSWRWCFYINVPLGIVATLGVLAFIPETVRVKDRKLDWYGFGFLSLTITCLQLVLDRGEQKGWFTSPEILTESALCIFGLYMFVVHSATSAKSFFDMRIFRDSTFMLSTTIVSIIFVVYYGSTALTPQMLQGLFNYPVQTSGLIMAPRGIGMIIAITSLRWLYKLVSIRVIICTGLIVTAISLYMMSGWSLTVPSANIVVVGMLQGAGTGYIAIPMSTLAFATLPTELRTEASGFYNLLRNIGSAIGISVSSSQLIQYTQINHARLGEFMTPFRHMASIPGLTGPAAIQMLNRSITQQATMVAYINVYWMLGILCLAIMPITFFLKSPKVAPATDHAVMAE
jgi:DHA2 family multidrug resistance protein